MCRPVFALSFFAFPAPEWRLAEVSSFETVQHVVLFVLYVANLDNMRFGASTIHRDPGSSPHCDHPRCCKSNITKLIMSELGRSELDHRIPIDQRGCYVDSHAYWPCATTDIAEDLGRCVRQRCAARQLGAQSFVRFFSWDKVAQS